MPIIKFKPRDDMPIRSDGAPPVDVLLDGERIGVIRKRAEWYGNIGKGVTYRYYDFFRVDDEGSVQYETTVVEIRGGLTREERNPLATDTTRKKCLAEALVRLGHDEAAQMVDPDTAFHYISQRAWEARKAENAKEA